LFRHRKRVLTTRAEEVHRIEPVGVEVGPATGTPGVTLPGKILARHVHGKPNPAESESMTKIARTCPSRWPCRRGVRPEGARQVVEQIACDERNLSQVVTGEVAGQSVKVNC
jgi:hypothetical protein